LGEAGLPATPDLRVDAITTEEAGYAAANELLARRLEFDAIVAASDLIALGAMRALQEQRIDVPAAVSVVGFDDIPAAALANPPLTTIAQNTRLAGEVLVDTLVRRLMWRGRVRCRPLLALQPQAQPGPAEPATPALRRAPGSPRP